MNYVTSFTPSTIYLNATTIGLVHASGETEEIMYRSLSLVRESSDDLIVVMTFSLLGLALSLLAVGPGGPIDAEYIAELLSLM